MLLLLACTKTAEVPDTGLGFDQPGWDDPTARRWERAGSWYPLDPDELDAEVEAMLAEVGAEPGDAHTIVAPHARFLSSGHIHSELYARVQIPDKVVLILSNHGGGEKAAIWTEGPWLVPGHAIAVDEELTAELQAAMPELVPDRDAFRTHTGEMQLPFLQWLNPEVEIAAISFRDTPEEHFEDWDLERIDAYGEALAGVLEGRDDVLVVGTTDLTHYVSVETSAEQDAVLVDHIAANDVEGLRGYVTGDEISICGEVPTALHMSALPRLGYGDADWTILGNSFHVKEDPEAVVGYGGVIWWR